MYKRQSHFSSATDDARILPIGEVSVSWALSISFPPSRLLLRNEEVNIGLTEVEILVARPDAAEAARSKIGEDLRTMIKMSSWDWGYATKDDGERRRSDRRSYGTGNQSGIVIEVRP